MTAAHAAWDARRREGGGEDPFLDRGVAVDPCGGKGPTV